MKHRVLAAAALIPFLLLTVMQPRASAQGTSVEEVPDAPRRPMTFEDMYALGRVSDPQPSPDGKSVAYVVTWYNLETNSSNSDIYVVDIASNKAVRLTEAPRSDANPRWSPDGTTIAFISGRENGPQVWLMNADGSNQRRLTSISTGATGVVWSPKGTHLLFSSSVYADCRDDACNKQRDEAREKDPCKARVIDRLPYRVWNSWKDNKFSHVFVVPAGGGTPVDLTPGEFDTPPIDLGGHEDYAISPDGQEIAYVKNTETMTAASTNNDIWLVRLDGTQARCITNGNKANDNQPVYSPDGRYIAYRAMKRPGYEADTYNLIVYDRTTGKTLNVTDGMDRSVEDVMWTPDSKRLLFSAQDEEYTSLFEVPAAGGDVLRVLKGIITLQYREEGKTVTRQLGTTRTNFRLLPDGKTLVFLGQRANYPAEVMSAYYDKGQIGDIRQHTFTNKDLLDKLELPAPSSFRFKSFDGTTVQGWILTPPGFSAEKKWPTIYIVHGGPQGIWGDEFHYRWNMELFAAPGYVVVAINPRGSTGFGQAFTDGVNGDWGGKPYKDIMTGVDYTLKTYPFIDKERIGVAGASYGGYMVNWIIGNTNRFKAAFTHSGVYDIRSKYGATEELWFPEWEFAGTPWTNPQMYEKWSPSRLAKNFRTPTLVSHGQLDFRVVVEQSMQLFTALQRQGIDSRFLYFPDEGHTILKPRNSQLWYREFHAWFNSHLKK